MYAGVEKSFTVTAFWASDAEVFTTESDIPGLIVEAAASEKLVDLVRSLAPEVIAANVPGARAPTRFRS